MLLSDSSQRHSRDTPLHCRSTCKRSHIVLVVLVVRVSTCNKLVVRVARVYTWGIWAVAVPYASLLGGIFMQTTTVNAVAHAWVCFCWTHLSDITATPLRQTHVSDTLATPHSAADPPANAAALANLLRCFHGYASVGPISATLPRHYTPLRICAC